MNLKNRLNTRKGMDISLMIFILVLSSVVFLPAYKYFWENGHPVWIWVTGVISLISLGGCTSYIIHFMNVKKILKSKYGNYLLIEYTKERNASGNIKEINYKIFTNHVLFYKKISDKIISVDFKYTSNPTVYIKDESNKILKKKYSIKDKFKEYESTLNKWDGTLDEIAKRENNINDVLN